MREDFNVMALSRMTLPRAGEFQSGRWNGRELIIVHRRWFPAAICWVFAAMAFGWVVCGMAFPTSSYVPDKDQFGPILAVAAAFAVIGAVIPLWKRVWRVCPTEGYIENASGFAARSGVRMAASDGLWIQLHPISIVAREPWVWHGQATVVHLDRERGVVVSVQKDADAAVEAIAQLARLTGLSECDEVGELIRAAA
jgi:hypothetical protein